MAKTIDHFLPILFSAENLDLDPEKPDGNFQLFRTRESHCVLFGCDYQFHVTLHTAIEKTFNFLTVETIMVGKMFSDLHSCTERFETALKALRDRDA